MRFKKSFGQIIDFVWFFFFKKNYNREVDGYITKYKNFSILENTFSGKDSILLNLELFLTRMARDIFLYSKEENLYVLSQEVENKKDKKFLYDKYGSKRFKTQKEFFDSTITIPLSVSDINLISPSLKEKLRGSRVSYQEIMSLRRKLRQLLIMRDYFDAVTFTTIPTDELDKKYKEFEQKEESFIYSLIKEFYKKSEKWWI